MKKILLPILLLWLLVNFSAHAQSGTTDVQLDGNKLNEANADLSQIDIEFCDKPGEKAISYTFAPGWIQDVCLKANNVSDKDIEATIEFVDGTVTNDQRKNKACMQQGQNTLFWQYVTGFTASFMIPANDTSLHHAKIQLPKSATWIVHGCLVYYTKSVEMWGQLNFSVLMRKAKFIDITIKSKAQSLKRKALGSFLVILLLFLYFKKFAKTKKLAKKK